MMTVQVQVLLISTVMIVALMSNNRKNQREGARKLWILKLVIWYSEILVTFLQAKRFLLNLGIISVKRNLSQNFSRMAEAFKTVWLTRNTSLITRDCLRKKGTLKSKENWIYKIAYSKPITKLFMKNKVWSSSLQNKLLERNGTSIQLISKTF